jgi:hypothetical protein
LEGYFGPLTYHAAINDALRYFSAFCAEELEKLAAEHPETSLSEMDLLNIFLLPEENAHQFLARPSEIRHHISLASEVKRYLLALPALLVTSRCLAQFGTWTNIRQITTECHEKVSREMSVLIVPPTSEGEALLPRTVVDLAAKAKSNNCHLLFHGTVWTSALGHVECPVPIVVGETDFKPNTRGLYMGNSWTMARQWAERNAQLFGDEPAVIVFQIPGSIHDLITREDNLSLDSDEDQWRQFVKCRVVDFHRQWRQVTNQKTSITGPVSVTNATGAREPLKNSWQMLVTSQQRLIDEIVPTTHAIIVWGGTPTDRKSRLEQHGL